MGVSITIARGGETFTEILRRSRVSQGKANQ